MRITDSITEKRKEYFNFRIFNVHFSLRKEFEYFDREKMKPFFRKVFNIRYEKETETDWVSKDYLSFYTGWEKPRLVYDTFSREDDRRHHLSVSLGWGILYLYFPWKNRKIEYEDWNNPAPKYGYYFYGEGKFFDEIVFYTGKQTDGRGTKTIRMPWCLDFYGRSVLLKDGSWWGYTDKEIKRAKKNGRKVWNDPEFNICEDDDRILKKRIPFTYTTVNGDVQKTTATCHVEVREWRPIWFKWTSLFKHVRRDLEITFDDEMGNQRGSWKGGVLGVSAPMEKIEVENVDFETPILRYEKKVNLLHDYCK